MAFQEDPLPTSVPTVATLATYRAVTANGGVVTTTGHLAVGDNGGASYVYHRTGRSAVTIGKVNIAGPGADDYWSLLVIDECKTKQFGCVGDGVANDRQAIVDADAAATAAGNVQITVTPGVYLISTSLTITNKVVLQSGARFKIASGATLTLSGGFVAEDDQYIFEVVSGGAVTVAKVIAVTPNHFGATTASANIKPQFDLALATATASGVNLLLPVGGYTASATISIASKSNVLLTGYGSGKSTLHFSAGHLDISQVSGLQIADMSITGNGQNLNGVYIRINSTNVTISNCRFSGFNGLVGGLTGLIKCEGVTGGVTITGCTFTGTGPIVCSDVVLVNCQDIICTNNQCLTNNADSFNVYNSETAQDIRAVISNNVVRDKKRQGMILAYDAQVSKLVVNSNSIHNCDYNGIYYLGGGTGESIALSGQVVISNNVVANCGGAGEQDGAGNSGIHISGHLGGVCTGNIIIDSGYKADGTKRAGIGYGILAVGASNWNVSGGNVVIGSAGAGFQTNPSFTTKNLQIHDNLFLDNGKEVSSNFGSNVYISSAGQPEDMQISIKDNTFVYSEADGMGIGIFVYHSEGIAPTAVKLEVINNKFFGRKLGTAKAGIIWYREIYAYSTFKGNKFVNYDSGFESTYEGFSESQDWGFGLINVLDDNTFEDVTTPFNLRQYVYNAVGKSNHFINSTSGYSEKLIPATIHNGILDGFYVERLPVRRCRTGDRFLPLYPGAASEAQWVNSTELPAAVAFTNSSGNNLTAASHGLAVGRRVRLAGGSLPAPLTPGDYFVSTVPNANNFTVNRNMAYHALPLTSTGSGTFQTIENTPTWLSDNWGPLEKKPNLVSRWNGSSESTLDAQARQNLAWVGAAAYSAAPTNKGPGYAFDLNGTDAALTAAIPAYTASDKWTICFWLNMDDLIDTQQLLSNFTPGNGWGLATASDSLYLSNSAGSINVCTPPIVQGEWIHLALVCNGASSGIFANGVRISTFTMAWGGTAPNILDIGYYDNGGSGQFFANAKFFDVRIYGVALTTGQLNALVTGPTQGYSDPVVYGVDVDGNLLRPVAASRKNLANALKLGLNNVFDYADTTIGDGTTNARAAIAAADTDGPVYLPPGVYAVATNLTITNRVVFDPGASLKPASGVVITLSGGYTAQPQQAVFDTSAGGSFVVTSTASDLADATVTSSAASAAITAATYLNLLANATIANAGLTTSGFTVDNTNKRVTYSGVATATFRVSVSASLISSKSTEVARLRLAKNGTTDADTEVARKLGTGADVVDIHVQGTFSLARNDYIELFGTLDASTSDTITIQKCNISIVKV